MFSRLPPAAPGGCPAKTLCAHGDSKVCCQAVENGGEKCLPRCARRILRQNFLMCAAAVALRKWGQLVGAPSETLFVFMGATVLGRAHYSMCHIPRGRQAEKLDKKSADYISLDRFCV